MHLVVGSQFSLTKRFFQMNLLTWIVAPIPKLKETDRKGKIKNKKSHVTCYVSHVTCRVSPVTCHLSLRPTATPKDPPPANTPLCTVGWFAKTRKPEKKFKHQKNHQNCKNLKTSRGMPILAIRSLTRSLQSTGKWVFHDGTDNSRI